MSGSVLLIIGKGVYKQISKKEMKRSYHKYEMICNGRIYGDENCRCTAPMSGRFSTRNGECVGFTEREVKNHPHTIGCEYDRRSTTQIISRLNFSGKFPDMQQFLSKLTATKDRKGKKIDGGENNGKGGNTVIDTEDVDGIEKKIKTTTRDPRNLKDLATLLGYLKTDHVYMNHKVQDWIVDNRTFSYHFGKGLPEGWMIVVAKLCNPDSLGFSVDSNEWILADCTFNGDPESKRCHWFYRLVCDSKARKKIGKFCGKRDRGDYYVIVCAKWVRDPQNQNLFISEKTTCKMVATVKKESMDIHK